MFGKALAIGAAALFASTQAQTQEEIDAYPEFATNFAKYGMTWETIKVHTDDGYTLTVWHITGTTDGGPIEITKPAVLFQHGMGGSAEVWTMSPISLRSKKHYEPMAFQIAKMGFDVYLANNSGTKYSQVHDLYTVD